MFYCICGNDITENDLLYIIEKGEHEDDMFAEDFDIEVYQCRQCNVKIYA